MKPITFKPPVFHARIKPVSGIFVVYADMRTGSIELLSVSDTWQADVSRKANTVVDVDWLYVQWSNPYADMHGYIRRQDVSVEYTADDTQEIPDIDVLARLDKLETTVKMQGRLIEVLVNQMMEVLPELDKLGKLQRGLTDYAKFKAKQQRDDIQAFYKAVGTLTLSVVADEGYESVVSVPSWYGMEYDGMMPDEETLLDTMPNSA